MKLGLAIWPLIDYQWVELALSPLTHEPMDCLAYGDCSYSVRYDLIFADADNPGPHFIFHYRELLSRFGDLPMLILGSPQSPMLSSMDWDPNRTWYIAKPCGLEDLRKTMEGVIENLQKVSGMTVPGGAGDKSLTKQIKMGYLSSLLIPALINRLCLNGWTGSFNFKELASDKTGLVMIKDGEILHAESGRAVGNEALLFMLEYGRCEYHFSQESPVRLTRTVSREWNDYFRDQSFS